MHQSDSANLFSVLYAELRAIAKQHLRRTGATAQVGATSLLHEAYVSMAARPGTAFPDRARFLGYATRVMRGLIIDRVREQRAIKRGGQVVVTPLGDDVCDPNVEPHWLTEMSAALDDLAEVDPLLAQVIDLRFFCGFSMSEVAAIMGTSERSVYRRWSQARRYLRRYLLEPMR